MRNDTQEIIWKRKYEQLKCMTAEMISGVDRMEFEREEEPIFKAVDMIYVSFNHDVVTSDEKTAIREFGKDNYDVYRLWKKSPKQELEDMKDIAAGNK